MYYYKLNKDKERWHHWFAWYPVTVDITDDGDEKRIWLQDIYRRRIFYWDAEGYWCKWQYKESL